ncbi:SusC/RagA family TonB-linked outer membrane protein [Chitinophaga costaii]|nr:SusC/RagA family TonB-linked outer membrane protein [Chitinophaga costaii]
MRLSFILMFAFCLRVTANVYSQDTKVTMHMEDVPLAKALSMLAAESNLRFLYDMADLPSASISLSVKEKPALEVLESLLSNTSLHFKRMNERLVVIAPTHWEDEDQPIKGKVTDKSGQPLVGVSVQVANTKRGLQTDAKGTFIINASRGDVLVFTYVGYERKEITVGGEDVITVVLDENISQLNTLVVTALGIEKQSKSLTYEFQQVNGKELETVKDASFVNSLTGKVAGLQINRSSSGVGGSTKVVLRGSKSLNGSNNVLYVVDGIPLSSNTTGQPSDGWSGQDGGDGISNINPDDIESISVLKGASASALYGSQAANGVILITTKKGKAGKTSLSLTSATTFENPISLPKFQNTYGQSAPSTGGALSPESWGDKAPAKNQPKDFFETGATTINSVAVTTGNDRNQTYISYSNTYSKGIMPANEYLKNNFSLRNTTSYLDNKLSLDESVNFITQRSNDRPSIGLYSNALNGAYLFPRSQDFTPYKTFEQYDSVRQIYVQNWPYSGNDQQNPYWIAYRNPTVTKLDRLMASITAKYNITNWLNLEGRVKADRNNRTYEQKLYASTVGVIAGSLGNYNYSEGHNTQTYVDLLLNANKKWTNWSLTATLGASLTDHQNNGLSFGGFYGKLLKIPNFFNISNMDRSVMSLNQTTPQRSQTQSVFGSATLGYKDMLFLEATGRNDWASALAFTNNEAFFYPSVGLTAVISSMAHLPSWITFAKVRASYSEVGNAPPSYVSTDPAQFSMDNGNLSNFTYKPFTTLKPERTKSWEAGTEWRFINDKLSLDLTVYKTNSYNQFFSVPASRGSGYDGYYINSGNVQNEGFEGVLGYRDQFGPNFTWNASVNFSLNRNKIIDLYDFIDPSTGEHNELDSYVFTSFDSYFLEARKGGQFGDIYARGIKKDDKGVIQVDDNGLPVLAELGQNKDYDYVGNPNPKFMLGFNNAFTFKNWNLNLLIDGRFGGKVVDMTEAYLDYYGVSAATGRARDAGGVMVNGKQIDAKSYYQLIGNRTGALALYAYSATNVRLREASLGYTLPGSKLNNVTKSIRLSVVARNVFFFYKKAPYDPDATLSTGNSLQGIDMFGMPSTRSIGFNLNVSF